MRVSVKTNDKLMPFDDAPGGSETVLVVDDDPLVLVLCRRLLAQYNYDVLTADDGEEALEMCRGSHKPIHLALVDVVLPGISGLEMVRKLETVRPEIRVVLMSGYGASQIEEWCETDLTNYGIVWKPFETKSLLRIIRNALDTPVRGSMQKGASAV